MTGQVTLGEAYKVGVWTAAPGEPPASHTMSSSDTLELQAPVPQASEPGVWPCPGQAPWPQYTGPGVRELHPELRRPQVSSSSMATPWCMLSTGSAHHHYPDRS